MNSRGEKIAELARKFWEDEGQLESKAEELELRNGATSQRPRTATTPGSRAPRPPARANAVGPAAIPAARPR